MKLAEALPLVTHQLAELRIAADESSPVIGSANRFDVPDWRRHAKALETVMAAAGLQVPA
jgi:hypothetical protein